MYIKTKNKSNKYHIVRIDLKSNRNIVKRGKINIHVHVHKTHVSILVQGLQ
jgi:hypothetical protein